MTRDRKRVLHSMQLDLPRNWIYHIPIIEVMLTGSVTVLYSARSLLSLLSEGAIAQPSCQLPLLSEPANRRRAPAPHRRFAASRGG
jgi:hypothetical protein